MFISSVYELSHMRNSLWK